MEGEKISLKNTYQTVFTNSTILIEKREIRLVRAYELVNQFIRTKIYVYQRVSVQGASGAELFPANAAGMRMIVWIMLTNMYGECMLRIQLNITDGAIKFTSLFVLRK